MSSKEDVLLLGHHGVGEQTNVPTGHKDGPLPSPLINYDPVLTPSLSPLAPCIFCDEHFGLDQEGNEIALLQHMFFQHRLVIADSQHVASLISYCTYWKARLSSNSPSEFFFGIDVEPNSYVPTSNPSGSYYLLSDQLPEDRALREGLQKKRLEWVLQWQEWERSDDTFERTCLFCKDTFSGKGSRIDLLKHLSSGHNLQLGHPHNLVFVDAMLDKLQNKLNQMLCIYCHKKFIDWFVLKEHMRKKQHKRVNPKDSSYDRFYVVNYLERGKDWHDIQNEKDFEDDLRPSNLSEDEEVSGDLCGDWSDWREDNEEENENKVHCLFCTWKCADLVSVIAHMREDHSGFDLLNLEDRRFYSLIKVVNYIRRKVQEGCCIVCDWPGTESQKTRVDGDMKNLGKKEDGRGAKSLQDGKNEEAAKRDALLTHMTEASHFACPSPKLWDWPEYFFPTYENDALLYVLGELCDEEGDEDNQQEMLQNMMGLLSCDSTENQVISEPNASSNLENPN